MVVMRSRSSQRGGVLLGAALILFGLSLLAAGSMLVLLWQDAGQSIPALTALIQGNPLPVPYATPQNPDDPLQPDFTVSAALAPDHGELEKQLRDPLRAYYATKSERLKKTVVEAASAPPHTARVTITLATPQGEEIITFFFDRTGRDHEGLYPKWEPSMFDNTK